MAEYMDLSEPGSIKVTIGIILAWMIFCAILLVGAGIRELKDSRAAEKAKIEQNYNSCCEKILTVRYFLHFF
jgi:hypothetical protein